MKQKAYFVFHQGKYQGYVTRYVKLDNGIILKQNKEEFSPTWGLWIGKWNEVKFIPKNAEYIGYRLAKGEKR